MKDLCPDIPELLKGLIEQALSVDIYARHESAKVMAQILVAGGNKFDSRSHTKEPEENIRDATVEVSVTPPSRQSQITSLKEVLDTAIRLTEWEEAERVLQELGQVAPYDSSLTIYRKRVEREMQPIYEARRKAEAEEERKRQLGAKAEIKWITIPAGEFLYGKDKQKKTVTSFQIAKYPVTNAQYYQFIKATKHNSPKHWQNGYVLEGSEDHPVVNVSWHDAQSYCKWARCRLPTEEEWEKAARGTDGREFPSGNQEPKVNYSLVTQPENEFCNFLNFSISDGKIWTTPVGQYSSKGDSPYGCADMAGNVWEWTVSKYTDSYVVRGGSWDTINTDKLRVFHRIGIDPTFFNSHIGFRCAR